METDNEKKILETARRHFVKYGYAGTTMKDIADEVKLTKAMVHYYFRSKEQLYNRILAVTLDYVAPRFAGAMSQEGDFWERLEKIVDIYFETLIEHPDIPAFILSELSQRKETLVTELKARSQYFPSVLSFMQFMKQEMTEGRIKSFPPLHLMLNVLGMTVFPFVAKPLFCTIFDFSDQQFYSLMEERKALVIRFLKSALEPD